MTVGNDIIQMKTATDYNVFDNFSIYDDLWMQLNNGGKWPVNNRVAIPMDIMWYSTNFKATMSMNRLTSSTITPLLHVLIQVQYLTMFQVLIQIMYLALSQVLF